VGRARFVEPQTGEVVILFALWVWHRVGERREGGIERACLFEGGEDEVK